MLYPYPKTFQAGDKWYYVLAVQEAAKGPFDSLAKAQEAMTAELSTRHGW